MKTNQVQQTPKVYITGLGRSNRDYGLLEETHLYEVVNNSYRPLCKRGFNRDFGNEFSIFRGNSGWIGCCQVCEGRASKGLSGLGWKRSKKLKKKIARLERLSYSPLLPGLPLKPDPKYFPEYQWDLSDNALEDEVA